jgi:hypothetical protein
MDAFDMNKRIEFGSGVMVCELLLEIQASIRDIQAERFDRLKSAPPAKGHRAQAKF